VIDGVLFISKNITTREVYILLFSHLNILMGAAAEKKGFPVLLTSVRNELQVKGIHLGMWVEL
jgi:hypothetical protein